MVLFPPTKNFPNSAIEFCRPDTVTGCMVIDVSNQTFHPAIPSRAPEKGLPLNIVEDNSFIENEDRIWLKSRISNLSKRFDKQYFLVFEQEY